VKGAQGASVGLFDYPVLMAADILLYDTDTVPVGEDQKQHVELARDLAERFNRDFGETFTLPEPAIRAVGARIMGLDDPSKKMSKSAASAKNYISLMDDEAMIRKKIKSAVTDPGKEIEYDEEKKPAISNLMQLFALVTRRDVGDIAIEYKTHGYATFKEDLAEALVLFLLPLQAKIKTYLEHEEELKKVLDAGAEKAAIIAEKKMRQVRKAIGVAL
jgi:tryptophanyl-tRNA synthetase